MKGESARVAEKDYCRHPETKCAYDGTAANDAILGKQNQHPRSKVRRRRNRQPRCCQKYEPQNHGEAKGTELAKARNNPLAPRGQSIAGIQYPGVARVSSHLALVS